MQIREQDAKNQYVMYIHPESGMKKSECDNSIAHFCIICFLSFCVQAIFVGFKDDSKNDSILLHSYESL